MSTLKPLNGNERFNTEAAGWDSNPDVHRASKLAFESIVSHFPDLSSHPKDIGIGDFDVLEIGCGTGLLSFLIAPHVRSLTAVDAASGMIDAFNRKLSNQSEVHNIIAVSATLTDPNDERIAVDPLTHESVVGRRFDLIISHLVLHHIPSLEEILRTMNGCLKSGGSVALTDFEDFGEAARRFHPQSRMEGVQRHGIPRKGMRRLLREAGFVDVEVETAFEMEKWVERRPGEGVIKGEGGEKMKFPFLICMGKKA